MSCWQELMETTPCTKSYFTKPTTHCSHLALKPITSTMGKYSPTKAILAHRLIPLLIMTVSSATSIPAGQTRGKKLIYLLHRLSLREQEELGQWLLSPLHGNSPQFLAFLEILLQEMKMGAEAVEAAKLHVAIPAHTDSPSNDPAITKARDKYLGVRLSMMMLELRKFLTWKQLDSDANAAFPMLFQALLGRDCEKHLPKNGNHSPGKPLPDLATRLKGELDIHLSLVRHSAAKGALNRPISSVNTLLDDWYLLEKLKYACADQPMVDSGSDHPPLLAAVLEEMEVRSQNENTEPVLNAYFNAYLMLKHIQASDDSGEAYYQRFRSLFRNNQYWSRQDAMDLFVHGHNYCILQFQQGHTRFIEDIKQLYDEVLEAGHPLQGGILPYQFYKNAVELMCKLKNYDWAEAFTERFRQHLAPEHAPYLHAYNQAIVSFFKQDYQAVVSKLYQQIGKLSSLQVGIGARVYLCRALWKTDDHTWLVQQLQAFEQHLRRNRELQAGERSRYQGFVRYLKRASQAVTGSSAKVNERLQALLNTIEEKEAPLLYSWLRQELLAKIQA